MEIPILILAAGASSRMNGADKLLQTVDGRPLVRRQAEIALKAGIGPVLIALPPEPHPRHDALAGLDLGRIAVADPGEGMNASLRTGINALPPCAAVMVLLADLPDLTADDLRSVAQAVDLDTDIQVWRGATDQGEPGHPVIFRDSLFGLLRHLQGDSGGREAIRQAGARVRLVPLPDARARRDLDTPQAWEAWRRDNPGRQGPGR